MIWPKDTQAVVKAAPAISVAALAMALHFPHSPHALGLASQPCSHSVQCLHSVCIQLLYQCLASVLHSLCLPNLGLHAGIWMFAVERCKASVHVFAGSDVCAVGGMLLLPPPVGTISCCLVLNPERTSFQSTELPSPHGSGREHPRYPIVTSRSHGIKSIFLRVENGGWQDLYCLQRKGLQSSLPSLGIPYQ